MSRNKSDVIEERVLEVDHTDAKEMLAHIMESRFKRALFLWGEPGIGKSEIPEDVARARAAEKGKEFIHWNNDASRRREWWQGVLELVGNTRAKAVELLKNPRVLDIMSKTYIFADLRLGLSDPTDMKGFPDVHRGEGTVWEPDLLFLVLSLPGLEGVLFLDEINHASESVQRAAYQLIDNRCIGETPLGSEITVVAAGNDLQDGGSVIPMSSALNNRFLHIRLLPPGAKPWLEWAGRHGIDYRVQGFVRSHEDALCEPMKNVKAGNLKAFPRPRSWAKLSRLIEDLPHKTQDQQRLLENLVASAVGRPAAAAFMSFIQICLGIDLDAVMKDPDKELKTFDIGRVYGVVSGLGQRLREASKETFKDCVIDVSEVAFYFYKSRRADIGGTEMASIILSDIMTVAQRRGVTLDTLYKHRAASSKFCPLVDGLYDILKDFV